MVGRAVFTTLALAAAGAVVQSQRTCTPSSDRVYFSGMGGGAPMNATMLDTCIAQCAQDSNCVAYNWLTFGDTASCGKVRMISEPVPINDRPAEWTSGRCGTIIPTLRGDFPGNDFTNAPALNADLCSYKCEATNRCNAYSWSTYNNGTCWMKTERTAALAGPFDGTVISGEVFKCRFFSENLDIVGNDMANVPRADWRECCGVCRRTRGCVASAWSDHNGGTCWLKSANPGTTVVRGVITTVL